MTYILRDCVEYSCLYYVLHFTDENVRRADIDNEINRIKNTIDDDIVSGGDMIRAILDELSSSYDFTIFSIDGFLEI